MKKIWLAGPLALMLTLILCVPALAQGVSAVWDETGLITQQQLHFLNERSGEIAREYNCGVYAVMLNDWAPYGDSIEDAAEHIYYANFQGDGSRNTDILLVVSVADRSYWLGDFGSYRGWALTGDGRERVLEAVLDPLGVDFWNQAMTNYLEECAVLLETARSNEPEQESLLQKAPKAYGIALVVGVAAAFITCSYFKSQMKTAVRATAADAYVAPEGVEMRVRTDSYTHTTRKERRIEKPPSSGGGGKKGSVSSGKF